MVVAEGELIKCRECGLIFSEDDAEICKLCGEHICPKCNTCGCVKRGGLHFKGRLA